MPFYPDPWAAERARVEGVIEEALYGVWRAQFPRLRKALVRRRYQLLAEQSAWQERNKGRRRREWRSKADSSPHTLYGVDVDWQAEQEALLADLKPALEAALNSAMFVMLQEYSQVAAGISWETYNAAAAEYAKKYTYDLVSQINGSTKQQLGEVIGEWIERGAEFPDLVERVWKLIPSNPYPNIRDRAQLIAATETTRVFADTQAATLKAMGLKTLHWRTAEDELVCFPAWTMVETETGPMPIQDIRPGVMVWTRHGLRRVKATSRRAYAGDMVTVRAGRHIVTSTADHPYWTLERGWLQGRDLSHGHTLQPFGDKSVGVRSVTKFNIGKPDYAPAVSLQIGGFASIPIFVSVPIASVDLQSNTQVRKQKIDLVAPYFGLLREGQAHPLQDKTNIAFEQGFAPVRSGANETTKSPVSILGLSPKFLPAIQAGDNYWWAAAFLRAKVSIEAFFRNKNLPTPFTVDVFCSRQSASHTAHIEAICDAASHRECFAANRTNLINLVEPVGLVAGARTKAALAYARWWIIEAPSTLSAIDILTATGALWFRKLQFVIVGRHLAPLLTKYSILYHRQFARAITVYNLEVEEHPEFYANGLLVHNCHICAPMGAAEGGEGALGSTETRLFTSPGTGGQVGIPAHPGCRCWAEASTAEMEERAAQLPAVTPGPEAPQMVIPEGAIPWEALTFEQKMDFYVTGFGMKPGGKLPKQVMEGQLSKPVYIIPKGDGKVLAHYDYDKKKAPLDIEVFYEMPVLEAVPAREPLAQVEAPAHVLQPATYASTLDYLKINHGVEDPEAWLQANPDKVKDLPSHFLIDEEGDTVFAWDDKAPLAAEQIGLAVIAPKPTKKPAKPKPAKTPQDQGYLVSELVSAYEPAGEWDGKLHLLTKPGKQAFLSELAPGHPPFTFDAIPTHYSKDPATGKVTYWFKPAAGKGPEDYALPKKPPAPTIPDEGFTIEELLSMGAEPEPVVEAPEPAPKPAKPKPAKKPKAPPATPAGPTGPEAAKGPAVLPVKAPFPHKVSDLAADKSMSLKGMHTKAVYVAPDGSKWLFKPQDEFMAYGDQVASDLAQALGHEAAETYVVEVGGKLGSIQRMFPIDGDLSGRPLTALGADDVHRIQKEGIFDWLIGNHDGHEANMVYSDGKLIGIDKGQLFKFYDADRLHWDYNPNHGFGVRGVHNKLLEAYVQGKDVPLANYLEDAQLSGFLSRIEALDDDVFKALLRPYAERAARFGLPNGRKALAYQDVDKFLEAATARKNGIRGAFGKLWEQAETARAKALGVERPAAATRLTGPNVVMPVNDAWAQEMKRAKWQGKSFLFGGEDVENMAGLVYQVEGDGTVLDFKIRTPAENTMLAKLGQTKGGANLVVPHDPYWDSVLKVAKSYNYHLTPGSSGYDGKVPATTVQMIGQLHTQLQGATDDVAAHYKQFIADLQDEVQKGQLGGQVGKVVTPWEYKPAPVERRRGGFSVTATPAQTLAVQNERGAIRLKPNETVKFNGKGFAIEFDGDMRANYTLHGDGNGSIYSKQGRMQIRIDGEFTTEKLDRALGYLEEMGVTARLATADDLELLYLQKVSEAAGVKASEVGIRSNLTATTRLKKYKDYWAQRMGVSDLAELPAYKPMPIFDSASRSTGSGGSGYGVPRWQRFDLTEADLDRELPNFGLMHNLYGTDSLDGLRVILENNGALVSTEEKYRIGVPIGGMSPGADQGTGGASYVFTRLADEARASRNGNLIFSKRLLLDPDVIMYDHDAFGKVSDDYATKNRKRTLADMRRGSGNYSNEVIVPRNISLIDYLDYVNVENDTERKKVLALLKQHGIEQIRGRSIETIVRVSR